MKLMLDPITVRTNEAPLLPTAVPRMMNAYMNEDKEEMN